MEHSNADIEAVILDIVRTDLIANDTSIDHDIREDALTQFMKRNSASLLDLLDELKTLRNHIAKGTIESLKKTHRVILEGHSEKSESEALSVALDKAAKYFSEDHDISITIQQLTELPNGGHRATVEVHITPLSFRDKPHVKGLDIELKRGRKIAFANSKHREEHELQYLIFDHFSALTKAKTIGHTPASYVINVNDAKLMHYMLEKQFLRAEMISRNNHQLDMPEPPSPMAPHPYQILVKVKREHD